MFLVRIDFLFLKAYRRYVYIRAQNVLRHDNLIHVSARVKNPKEVGIDVDVYGTKTISESLQSLYSI